MKKLHTEKGYIALFTVLIVTSVLLIVVVASNTGGFHSNSVIMNALAKEESRTAARSCMSFARARLALDSAYEGNEELSFSGIECRIEQITSNIVEVSAESRKSKTAYQAIVDLGSNSIEILEWKELNN